MILHTRIANDIELSQLDASALVAEVPAACIAGRELRATRLATASDPFYRRHHARVLAARASASTTLDRESGLR